MFPKLLLPSCKEGITLIPATEIMFMNSTISRIILEEQDSKIVKAIRSARTEGMQDFELSLYNLVTEGFITKETALEQAENPQSLDMS